jgi:hypothetical protein
LNPCNPGNSGNPGNDGLHVPYSARNASIGWMRAARCAGTKPATRETVTSSSAVVVKVNGSVGVVSNNRLDTRRAPASAPASPMMRACQCQAERAAKHFPPDIACSGTECHAYTDFLRSLSNAVPYDAVNSQAGERQRHQRESAEQRQEEAPWRGGALDEILERPEPGRDEIRIALTKRRAHLRPERLDRQHRSNNQMLRDRIGLRDRQVHLCHRAFLEAGLAQIGDDADDTPLGPLLLLGHEQPADRGLHAEQLEEARRDGHGDEAFSFSTARQLGVAESEEGKIGREIVERPRLAAELLVDRDGYVWRLRPSDSAAFVIHTSRSPSGNGSGRRTSGLATLNTAVLAPMPRPRITMATTAKPGCRRRPRRA